MNFNNDYFLAIAYSVSNILGVLFLVVAFKWPKIARFLLVALFGWASWFNYTRCHLHPEIYQVYGQFAVGFYKDFINGWFSEHITAMVSWIAIGQAFIGFGLLLNGNWVKLACVGAIVFLLCIAPLGMGSAFPFSLTVSLAAYFIIKRDDLKFFLIFGHNKSMKLLHENQ